MWLFSPCGNPCTLRRHVSYRSNACGRLFSCHVSHRGDARGRLFHNSPDLLLGLLGAEPSEKRVGDEHLQDALGGRIDGGEEVD